MPAGRIERVQTSSGKVFTQQRLRNGRTIYRCGGRFCSRRAFIGARSHASAEIEAVGLGRAGAEPGALTPRTQWIREGDKAGDLAPEILPELKPGEELTDEQRKALMREVRFVHGFENFWLIRSELTRDEAMDEFRRMIDQLRKRKTAAEREAVRISFGLPGGSGFDARQAA